MNAIPVSLHVLLLDTASADLKVVITGLSSFCRTEESIFCSLYIPLFIISCLIS